MKREHQPLNYDVLRDRRKPPGLPCMVVLLGAVGAVIALVFVGLGIANAARASSGPVPTLAIIPSATKKPTASLAPLPSDTITPDAWGITGTAIARATTSPTPTSSPTLDYCWFLTPSPTASPTLPYTPDAWDATGTAIYEFDHPLMTPSPEPPREDCVDVPTWTPAPGASATLTPLALPSLPVITDEVSAPATMTLESLPVIDAPDTWTPQPTNVIQRPPA